MKLKIQPVSKGGMAMTDQIMQTPAANGNENVNITPIIEFLNNVQANGQMLELWNLIRHK